MATDTEILREFLIKLGFKTDERSLKSFASNVESATKLVMGLATAIAGSATLAAFQRFASGLEVLYFSVLKTGATAGNLKAFEKSAQNFGASAGEALQSVQALARWMRETPGSENFLQGLGVNTRDTNGRLKDTTQIMTELGRVLGKMDYPMARQYGNLLGIGEDTLRAIMSGEFSAELEKQQRLLKDSGYDEATKKAHEFMVKLRELQTRIEAIGVTIGTDLIDVMNKVGPFVLPILDKIGEAWKNIYDWVKAAGEKINEVAPKWLGDKIGAGTAWLFDKLGIREQVDAAMAGNGATTGNGSAKAAASTASAADPVRFFMGMGWSKDQAAGIVANLQRESGMRANAVGDNGQAYGIAQWHPDRQANFAKWAGKDIRNSTVEEQMRFVNYELTQGAERRAGMLLRAAQSAEMAGIVMSKHYERPRNAAEEAAVRGAAAVQIAQNTTINVNGGDAAATGRAVANEQNSVNQNLARNLQTAVQ